MTYDPNERIAILLNVTEALARLEYVGVREERMDYHEAATRARDYLRAYDIYSATTEPIPNHRIETPTITQEIPNE